MLRLGRPLIGPERGSDEAHSSAITSAAYYCKSTNGPCIHACAMIYRVYGNPLATSSPYHCSAARWADESKGRKKPRRRASPVIFRVRWSPRNGDMAELSVWTSSSQWAQTDKKKLGTVMGGSRCRTGCTGESEWSYKGPSTEAKG